jgi:hypothetical protein
MKTRCCLLVLGWLLAMPAIRASESSAPAEGSKSNDRSVEIPDYILVPGCGIRSMTPVTATVTHRHVDRAFLKTADGQKITIGGFGSTPDIVRFIASLKVNTVYRFPEVFLDHEKALRGEPLEIVELVQKNLAQQSEPVLATHPR